ncbi:HAMP domain-containing methyl-accepting chemotaxis protein [Methanospirillum sp.]|uniref:HAMP domain-containing methyl-accepting chemotaxis protein n=1 Tax=Methanospirillum sp. TaxID=45200 RepID=UPI002D7F04DB|nr:methyl-accepting chemotaxis protein [Methanospirillum sp.]
MRPEALDMMRLQFIDNIRIGQKLIGGFVLVTLLMCLIGVIGFSGMNTISGQMDHMYTENTIPLTEIASMEVSLNSMRALVFRSMAIIDEREQDEGRLKTEIASIESQIQNLSSSSMTPDEAKVFETFKTQWVDYKKSAVGVFELEKAKKEQDALTSIKNGGEHANARRATVATFDQLKQIVLSQAEITAKAGSIEVKNSITFMTVVALVIIIISLFIAFTLTRSITEPLHQVMNQFDRMSRGEINTRLTLFRKDEIGKMAGMADLFSDFLEQEVVVTLQRIARGDLSTNLTPKSESDQITPALIEMSNAVTGVITELDLISSRAAEGDLKARGDEIKFHGSYQQIVKGFNTTLQSLTIPINEAIRLASEYSKCNFVARFSNKVKVKGDFVAFERAMNEIGLEVSRALGVIGIEMKELESQAKMAESGIEDVQRGAGIIAANADSTRANAEMSEEEIIQVLRGMEDLTNHVMKVSANVEAVAQSGTETDRLARKGITAAASAEEGMESIRKVSGEATSIIFEIRDQMVEISRITDIISDIAEQTNLLALNAAIEAARAGDAGRGFAVVAGEVKGLAEQVGTAAQKIATMISELDNRSSRATTVMKEAESVIEDGSISLRETLEIFSSLTKGVQEIKTNMDAVASSSEQQAASFEEITASVHEMSAHVKQTSQDAMNSSSTAEEALSIAQQITDIINDINTAVSTTTTEMQRFLIA